MGNLNEEIYAKEENRNIKVSEDGTQLELVEEFERLLEEYLDLDYMLREEIDSIEEDIEYSQTKAKQAKIANRIAYLNAQCAEWRKNARVLVGPLGAYLEEVLNDTEIMSNDDLRKKFELFQKKCTIAHMRMNIECDFKRGHDDKLICIRINGASEVLNRNCRTASIDFETGHIENYADSIRPDWVIDERYEDPSIILVKSELSDKEEELSKLEKEEKLITETEKLIDKQKGTQVRGE